jgi:hypothetical protein
MQQCFKLACTDVIRIRQLSAINLNKRLHFRLVYSSRKHNVCRESLVVTAVKVFNYENDEWLTLWLKRLTANLLGGLQTQVAQSAFVVTQRQ